MASSVPTTSAVGLLDPINSQIYNSVFGIPGTNTLGTELTSSIGNASNQFKQSALGEALYGVPAYQAPSFNESSYNVPSYNNVWEAGTNQDEENLAAQNSQTLASQQAGGTLNSGSTGMGLSNNLQGFQNNQTNLANNIANMQYNDALQQYETQVAAGEQNYQTQQSNANNLRSTLGSALGAALVAAALW